jgi:hypothetical protein
MLPLALLALGTVLLRRRALPRLESRLPVATLFVAALAAGTAVPLLLHHRGGEIYYFNWYVTEVPVLAGVALAAAVRPPRALAAAAVAALCLAVSWEAHLIARREAPLGAFALEDRSFQHVALQAARRAQDVLGLDADARIGGQNVGLVGYLLPAHVVNLDGLANDDVWAWLGAGHSLADYVRARAITAIVDACAAGGWLSRGPDEFETVEVLPFSDDPRGFCIWRAADPSAAVLRRRDGS